MIISEKGTDSSTKY